MIAKKIKAFCSEGNAQIKKEFTPELQEDVLRVELLDSEGNLIDESTLSEDQVKFASKVAIGTYKKFASSRKLKFDAEEDVIQVEIPEDYNEISDEEINEVIDSKVDELENEVIMDPQPIEPKEEEPRSFASKRKFRFSSDDLKEAEKLEDQIEVVVDMIEDPNATVSGTDAMTPVPVEEVIDPNPLGHDDNNMTPAISFSSNRSFSSKHETKDFCSQVIENQMGGDSFNEFKQNFLKQ